jgi:hypothetical protein
VAAIVGRFCIFACVDWQSHKDLECKLVPENQADDSVNADILALTQRVIMADAVHRYAWASWLGVEGARSEALHTRVLNHFSSTPRLLVSQVVYLREIGATLIDIRFLR